MNIFAFFRKPQPKRADWLMWEAVRPRRVLPVERPPLAFRSRQREMPPVVPRIFEPTHVHLGTGGLYMLTAIGERLEVTGDDAYPLAEYENAEGECFAQRADRFNDGRFLELAL